MQQQIRPINQAYSICEHKLLGKGFRNNDPSFRVAIKSIDLSTIDNEVTRYLLSCEIAALSNLGKMENTAHENIVRLIDIVMERKNLYLIMELLEGGTLSDYIKQNPNGLPEEEAIHIFKQILQGYSRIKDKKIVHRDLKPDNILFKRSPKQSKTVAIIDFGYCQMDEVPNKPNMFYNVGSPKYMAPEAYKQNQYSQKSDIWAIGVMLYQMLMGSTCDKGMSMEQYLDMLEHRGVPIPKQLRMFHQHLISIMLAYNHHQRTGVDRVRKEVILNYPPQPTMEKNSSQTQLRTTMKQIPQGRPRQQVLFHSVILPQDRQALRQRHINDRGLRTESRLGEPNENRNNDRFDHRQGQRANGFSFHVQNMPPHEHKHQLQQPILGRVQNVELNSAKQIVHRRPIQHERRQEQAKNQQQYPPPPMLAKQSTMINLPTTPMAQSNTFFQGPRQMTPVAGQHFHIPNQPPRSVRSSNIIIVPQQKQAIQSQKPFFNGSPQSVRNNGSVVQSQMPIIVEKPEFNEQVRHQGLPPPGFHGPVPLMEKRGSLRQIQPQRYKIHFNGHPDNINRPSYEPERRQSPFRSPVENFHPQQRRPEPVRGNTFQHYQIFQPIPQVMNLKANNDRQKYTRITPQTVRQPQYRYNMPHPHMRMIRQTFVK